MLAPLVILFSILPFSKRKRAALQLTESYPFDKVRLILLSSALLMLSLASLDLKSGGKPYMGSKSGLEIYFLLDISKSMMAEDVKPSRFIRARSNIVSIIKNLKDDRVGLIPFSDEVTISVPLTNDYEIFLENVEGLEEEVFMGGGTNIGEAIALAEKSFDQCGSSEATKIIILLSDGEDHDSYALKKSQKTRAAIYGIGIGTLEGGLIPDREGYMKGEDGQPIISKINEKYLESIADKFYIAREDGSEIKELIYDLSKLRKGSKNEVKMFNHTHYFQFFIFLGLVLLALALSRKRGKASFFALMFVLNFMKTDPAKAFFNEGNYWRKKGEYEKGAESYSKAIDSSPNEEKYMKFYEYCKKKVDEKKSGGEKKKENEKKKGEDKKLEKREDKSGGNEKDKKSSENERDNQREGSEGKGKEDFDNNKEDKKSLDGKNEDNKKEGKGNSKRKRGSHSKNDKGVEEGSENRKKEVKVEKVGKRTDGLFEIVEQMERKEKSEKRKINKPKRTKNSSGKDW